MSDYTSVMAPGPTEAAARDRREKAMLSQLWDEVVKPTLKQAAVGASFVGRAFPQPAVSIPSSVAYNMLTEEDPMLGLMQAGGDVVGRYVPGFSGVMNVAKRVSPTDEAVYRYEKGFGRGEDYLRKIGAFLGFDKVPVREIKSHTAKLTPKAEREWSQLKMSEDELSKILDYPELFAASPELKTIPTKIENTPGPLSGRYMPFLVPQNQHLAAAPDYIPERIDVSSDKPLGNVEDVVGGLLHEVSHAQQVRDRRPYGTGSETVYRAIGKNEVAAINQLPVSRDRKEQIAREIANELYMLNLGEREAYAAEMRRMENPRRPFNEDVRRFYPALPGHVVDPNFLVVPTPYTTEPRIATKEWWRGYKPVFDEILKQYQQNPGP